MQFLKILLIISLLSSFACKGNKPKVRQEKSKTQKDILRHRISKCQQLLLSLSDSLNAKSGKLYIFDKKPKKWFLREGPYKVNYGKNGLAWGLGLHKQQKNGIQKREGDGRSPAGIFEIGTAFGYDKKPRKCKTNYLQIDHNTQCIEDARSKSYNRIIDNEVTPSDWNSTDLMKRNDDLFKYGFFVNHNIEQIPGKGSCIFFHLWKNEKNPTAGCTALSEKNMFTVINWLDFWRKPLLVQMPIKDYIEFRKKYELPALK